MKLSKRNTDLMLKREIKIVLPRVKLSTSKLKPNGLFKRKKTKCGRNSSGSDKENKNSFNTIPPQPEVNLIQIEKVLDIDRNNRYSKQLELSEKDRKLILDTFNNEHKVGPLRIKSSESNSNDIVSQSLYVNLSQVTSSTGTPCSSNGIGINGISLNPRRQQNEVENNKCYRKDSGIDMESPKKKTSKRKLSQLSNDSFDDILTENVNEAVSSSVLSNSEICDIENIIQSHSSHHCTDKIDRKINNIETLRTPNGSFLRKDFVIRIQQCCVNKPCENSAVECSTSVIANTSKCENIQKSAKKVCQSIAVEKKVGINTRTKLNGKETLCQSVVESKYVQTLERSRKKIKSTEPSTMVTRRKAANNDELEFYSLIDKRGYHFLVRNARLNQSESVQKDSNTHFEKETNDSYKNSIVQEKKRLRNQNQKIVESKIDHDEFISNTKQLRKSLRSVKSKNEDTQRHNCSSGKKDTNQTNSVPMVNDFDSDVSIGEGTSGIPAKKGKKTNLKLSTKLKDSEPIKNTEINVVNMLKDSNLSAKKLMTHTQASAKTTRYNSRKLKNVQTTTKTPKTVPGRENARRNHQNLELTPYILLDKLDVAEVSTYAITPLREDRLPNAPKSSQDYGIDDVVTDESTDDENYPKKIVPQWAKSLGHQPKVQFHFPRDIIRNWIRPPKKRFTVKSLFC